MAKRTTIHDIAKVLNLNSSTISRGLQNHSYIKKATAKLIQKTAVEMNYKPNTNASNLRTGESQILGVVVPQINMSFFSNIIAGIEEISNNKNYNIIICQSHDSFEREIACINTLVNQNVACIMISLAAETQSNYHLKTILSHHIPLIQFDRIDEKLKTCKIINNETGIVQAIDHLIDQGFKKIAYLSGPQNISTYRNRKKTFIDVLTKKNIVINKNHIAEDCFTKEKAIKAVKKMLMMAKRPDSIIASADFMILATLEVARELNIKIPEELGVCGYANEVFTELTTPSLSSINQNSFEMGNAVAKAFFDAKNKKNINSKKEIIIDSQLIIRASTLRK